MATHLTDQQTGLLLNALRVAADQYRHDAIECIEAGVASKRLAEQFERQAAQANELRNLIESEEKIVIQW